MADATVSAAASRFVDAWELAIRRRLRPVVPDRQDRRVLLGPIRSPLKGPQGAIIVGSEDANALNKLGRRTTWQGAHSWPRAKDNPQLQSLAIGLTRELSAGRTRAVRPDRDSDERLAHAVGTAVARSHYRAVVTHLTREGVLTRYAEGALRDGSPESRHTPHERLVTAFAETVESAVERTGEDGPLLERIHADERPDKAEAAAEILVNRSPSMHAANHDTRSAATSRLSRLITERLTAAMADLSFQSETVRGERAAMLGREIGRDVRTALDRSAEDPAQDASADTARVADGTAAARLAGDGVADPAPTAGGVDASGTAAHTANAKPQQIRID